ncbi:sulfatase-like hydrolase/transferase [Pediococcus argentinicus]|uniref:LTA synthase family protein n=1 Tax=Pediococcus argentinicus TaxID=480391 RepID=UPI00338D6812
MFTRKRMTIYIVNIMMVVLVVLGSLMTYTHFSINEAGFRGYIVEFGSSLRPILENVVLLLLAYKLVKDEKKVNLIDVWSQILFYSVTLGLLSMSLVLTRLNISNFVRSFLPVTFLTNSFAVAMLVMVVLNKFIREMSQKSQGIIWWLGLIVLSVLPTIIWSLKIPNFNNFQFGTVLWGVFILLTVYKLNDHSNASFKKYATKFGGITFISAVVLMVLLNKVGNNAFLQNGLMTVQKLAMLPSNFFAFGVSLLFLGILKHFNLNKVISFSLITGVTLFMTHFLLIDAFWNKFWQTGAWNTQTTFQMLLHTIIILLIMVPILFSLEKFRELLSKQIAERNLKVVSIVMISFVLSCLSNIVLLNTNALFNFNYIYRLDSSRPQLMLLNIILFMAFMIIIFTVTNKILVGTVISTAIIGAFTFGDYQKMVSRNEPVMPIDITSNLKNISELADLVNIWLVYILLLVIFIVIGLSIFYEKRIHLDKPLKWYHRITMCGISLLILVFFIVKLPLVPSSVVTWKSKDYTKTNLILSKQLKYLPHPGAINLDFQANGPAVGFISRFRIPVMDKPATYSEAKIQSISNKYANLAKSINAKRDNNIKDDVVVYLLSESFSNPNRVPSVKTATDPIPYTNQIKKENTSGIMDSYGYGGGTADIEFEALSGMSLNNFSPALSTPYVELMPKLDYMPSVLDLFGTKNAIHPFDPGLYNRVNVFKQLGFSKFYNTKNPNKVTYTNRIKGSKYISDLSAYKELIKVMNENKKGQFIQLSTMQNHMPYNKNEYQSNFPVSGPLTGESKAKLETYTEGIHTSDNSLKYLISKLNKEKRHVTLVYYGDHLPGAYQWMKDNEKNVDKYDSELHQTDYFVYSNYTHRKVAKKVVAPYMFTPMMLQQTNSKVSSYYALLTKCMEELPAGEREKYMLSDGKQITESRLTESQKKLLNDYKMIQYDLTAGKHYLKRNSNFFKVN